MSRLTWFSTVALAAALAGGCKKEQPKKTEAEPAAATSAPAADQAPSSQPEAPETPETSMPAVGDKAPEFQTVAHDGTEVSVAALRGEPFVLYFYPRDDTPG